MYRILLIESEHGMVFLIIRYGQELGSTPCYVILKKEGDRSCWGLFKDIIYSSSPSETLGGVLACARRMRGPFARKGPRKENILVIRNN